MDLQNHPGKGLGVHDAIGEHEWPEHELHDRVINRQSRLLSVMSGRRDDRVVCDVSLRLEAERQ
jgi:hypothetical protein